MAGERFKILVLIGTLLALPNAEAARTKLETPDGYVSLQAAADWTLISAKTRRPVSSALFQIPNPSDQGTPDSTSLGLKVYDLRSESGRASATKARLNATARVRERSREGRWLIYRQQFADDGDPVPYTTLTARQDTPDMLVMIDLTWPKLPNNPGDYDAQMERLFRSFIGSVQLHAKPPAPESR